MPRRYRRFTLRRSMGQLSISTDEHVFATLGDDEILREACFSCDGTAAAFIVSRGSEYIVRNANGVRVSYDIAINLVVGPLGATTACQARLGYRALVPINGNYDDAFKWVSDPVLSGDGCHVAYWGMELYSQMPVPRAGEVYYLVENGNRRGPYRASGHITFHPADSRLVYSVREEGASCVFVGGVKGPLFEQVLRLACHPRDKSVWYWARRERVWSLMRDDCIVGDSKSLFCPPGPIFGRDGNSVAYWQSDGKRWSAVCDERVLGTVDQPIELTDSIAISATGDVAYAGCFGDSVYVTVAGERQGPFDAVGAPTFSADGRRIGYLARRGDRQFLMLDGVKADDFEVIWPDEGEFARYLEDVPTFRADGSSVAYRVCVDGKECIIQDKEAGERFNGICGAPAFSPASGSLIYSGTKEHRYYVVIDGALSDAFDRVFPADPRMNTAMMWTPTFSGDGSKVVFGALSEGRLCWRVLAV
jgi:hypothetical protein